jgi:hypothetical protein
MVDAPAPQNAEQKSTARFFIYFIATFVFAVLPILIHIIQRGGLSGNVASTDLFPSPDWFVYSIAIWAATLAELGHEPKIGDSHLLIAICATIAVLLASLQYAQMSAQLEALRSSGRSGLTPELNMWFTRWNEGIAGATTFFAIVIKVTEKKRR